MSKRLDLTGQRFGRLVVLKPASKKGKHTYWDCQCSCGNIKSISTSHLRSGHSKSCGCSLRKEVTGQRFGRLKVLGFDHKSKKGAYWKCQCDCGNIKITKGGDLRSGGVTSCGCLWFRSSGEAAFNSYFYNCKRNAKQRNYNFSLSKKEVRKINQQNCHYCGVTPQSIQKGNNSDYIYNGIDRVDNSKGYVGGNVVACCAKCNRMKMAMPQKDFLAHVERIHKHQHNSK